MVVEKVLLGNIQISRARTLLRAIDCQTMDFFFLRANDWNMCERKTKKTGSAVFHSTRGRTTSTVVDPTQNVAFAVTGTVSSLSIAARVNDQPVVANQTKKKRKVTHYICSLD